MFVDTGRVSTNQSRLATHMTMQKSRGGGTVGEGGGWGGSEPRIISKFHQLIYSSSSIS